MGTLVIAAAINARANQLVKNDAVRAEAEAVIVDRLETKLNEHITVMEAHANQPPPTITVNILPASNTQSGRVSTSTVRPQTTTTIPRTTTTTQPVATTTTLLSCRLAILSMCVLR